MISGRIYNAGGIVAPGAVNNPSLLTVDILNPVYLWGNPDR